MKLLDPHPQISDALVLVVNRKEAVELIESLTRQIGLNGAGITEHRAERNGQYPRFLISVQEEDTDA